MNRLHIVYTSGKVGSTTMVQTLKTTFPEDEVFTVRRLTAAGIAEHRAFRPIVSDDVAAADLLAAQPNTLVNLVTLTREPVAAAVSSFFYNLEYTQPDCNPYDTEVQAFADAIVNGNGNSTPTFHVDWFDREFTLLTGASPYEVTFDHGVGYQLLESGRFRSLILRVEDLDRVGPAALQSFFGTSSPIELASRANAGSDAAYAAAYGRFLQVAALPDSWVSTLYKTRYAKHFYRDTELLDFAHRWTRGLGGSLAAGSS